LNTANKTTLKQRNEVQNSMQKMFSILHNVNYSANSYSYKIAMYVFKT